MISYFDFDEYMLLTVGEGGLTMNHSESKNLPQRKVDDVRSKLASKCVPLANLSGAYIAKLHKSLQPVSWPR
jgi:hypothetical protein